MIRSVGYWSIAFLILLAPATAFASDLKIANAWVSAPILDEDARAYLVIQNKGSKARKLVGASSPGAESVEIHRATIQNGPTHRRSSAISIFRPEERSPLCRAASF